MQLLSHRGPDSQGRYLDAEVVLGHLRLKVIDLSDDGNQPICNENKDMLMVCNGEIFNFQELRRELESRGHLFKSKSDNEVIIHSYEEWGAECLGKLRGMFAFAIWEERKKKLFLARDRLGIKPLYYYFQEGEFIFASEVRAILATGLIPQELSNPGLLSYLQFGGLKEPFTIIARVYSLLPAHYLILDLAQNDLEIKNYWDPLKIKIIPGLKTADIRERLKFLLEDCVRISLVSDVPLGIFLSGGIDSSALVSLAAGRHSQLKTISVVFREKKFNEAKYSRAVAQRFNTEHHEIPITDNYILQNLNCCLQAMDQPTFNGINTYFISKAAKEIGLVVALSGLGGDEIFCGYPSFYRVINLLRLRYFWNKLPDFLKRATEKIYDYSLFETTVKRKIAVLLKQDDNQHPYFWTRLLFTEREIGKLLKQRGEALNIKFNLSYKEVSGLGDLDIINQVSYLEMTNYMVDILLRDTDSMSMAHSLEVRVPYLDHELIEFLFSVPGNFKLNRKISKPLLVESVKGDLPNEITQRKKMGFVFPFDYWMRTRFRDELEQTLLANDIFLDSIIDNAMTKSLWSGFLKKRIFWQRPWAIFVLKKWIQNYLK